MHRLTCLLLISLMAASVGIPVVHAQDERLVLAFYYAWFDQNTWKSGQLADQPMQPYDSRDRAAIQRHVSQAQSAGIDAFVQSWYGPSGGANNMTESNLAALLDVSAQSGFRAAVDFEVTSPFFGSLGDVQGALAALLAGHARHPAYLQVNGKPVVFFWRQQRFSIDDWAAIRKRVDPNRASIWIAEGTDPSYLRVFEGIYWYSVAWSADPVTSLVNYAAKVRKTAQDLGFRYWVSPVMPGYDDTKLRGAGGFIRPRDNGNYYRATFEGASKSGADWVVVTSFNEWPEGSMIEPSISYGDAYLGLTRELAAAFRANAAIIPATMPVESPTALATSVPVAIQAAQAAPTPTAVQIALPTSTETVTPSPAATETGTPTLTPTVSPSATALLTETPLPTETPTPAQASDPEIPPAVLVIVGVAALVFGAVLGSVSARRRSLR